jgi:hypothetical protein
MSCVVLLLGRSLTRVAYSHSLRVTQFGDRARPANYDFSRACLRRSGTEGDELNVGEAPSEADSTL